MRLLNKLLTHAGSLAAFISALRAHHRFLRSTAGKRPARPVVYIEFSHNILRRYMFPLVVALLHDYDVRIGASFSLVGRFVDSERLLLRTPGVRFCLRRPRGAVACLHDRRRPAGKGITIFVNRDYFNRFGDRSPRVLQFPFPMHPDRYHPEFRNNDAGLAGRMRILFAGNIDPRYYDDPSITEQFGLLSRTALYGIIATQLREATVVPETFDGFRDLLAGEAAENRLVFIDTGKFGIPAEKFLSVLDHADFFLALPGTKIPHSHNCIEALSRGCIPILQYGDLFPQPLTHGINSLRYETADEFIRVVRQALAMTAGEVRRMSEAAATYYRNALSHETFMRDFRDKIGRYDKLELIINAERRSL